MTAAAGTLVLAWRLLRGGGRRDATTQALGVLAFAVATGLLLLTVGINAGFGARADRQAWTVPGPAGPAAAASALMATRTQFYGARPVTVVTLATLTPGAPVPPGLAAFPAPGQVWLSPALADLVQARPADLAGRWPGRLAGRVGARGLAGPDQLLVVVGAAPDALQAMPPVTDVRSPGTGAGPTAVTRFAGRAGAGTDRTYADLTLIASVLLVVPLLTLGGAAARLGLARRDQRLAVLRLAGASSRQILTIVAVEAAAAALVGAALGALPYTALLPLVSRVPFGGGRWYPGDLWLGGPLLAAVLLAVTAGGALSALVTLRRVVVSPLGVTQRRRRTSRQLWRALVFLAAVVGYLRLSRSSDPSLTTLVVAFGIVFLALSLLGPAVLALLGRAMVATARRAARLLAGRRLLDDPQAAWRTVGGLALTGFVAGFLALFPSSSTQITWGSADTLQVAVPAATAAAARSEAQAALREAGLPGQVAAGPDGGALVFTRLPGAEGGTAYLSVPVTPADREQARTALHGALPGLPVAGGPDLAAQDNLFVDDVHRASTAILLASFLVAIASAGITACAAVLDRRQTYRQLHLAGVPMSLLDKARRTETTAPLLLLVLGSLATGLLCGAPVTKLGLGSSGLNTPGLVLLAGTVLTGLLAVRAASAASRPLLRTVATTPT